MEEFERIDILLDFHHRAIKRERVIDDIFQGIEVHILSEEGTGYVVGDVLERHVLNVVEEGLRQFLDFLWHVETAVLCQSFYHRLVQVGNRSVSVGAVVLHNYLVM